MQPQKPKRIHVILLIALIAAEAALVMLYVASRTSGLGCCPNCTSPPY